MVIFYIDSINMKTLRKRNELWIELEKNIQDQNINKDPTFYLSGNWKKRYYEGDLSDYEFMW